MLLAIDVGNTNTVLGVYRAEKLMRHWRVQTEAERTVDEYGVLLQGLFGASAIELAIDGAIISCVVPPMQKTVEAVSREYLRVEPMTVGPGIKTGMPILYDNPKEVGADRNGFRRAGNQSRVRWSARWLGTRATREIPGGQDSVAHVARGH